jgi:beta-galactosidase
MFMTPIAAISAPYRNAGLNGGRRAATARAFLRLTIFGLIIQCAVIAFATGLLRERLSLDDGWKFRLSDEWGTGEKLDKAGDSVGPARSDFNDTAWRSIRLPHDWAVELPFDAKADRSHGYKPLGPGYPENSVGWYRRTFGLSAADKSKRLWLEFDGVARDCRVFLNGYRIAHHESGYSSFRCDITDVANFNGKNTLVVRADASQFEGWFYEGAGIYRHVWLLKTAPLAIAPDGTFVYSRIKDDSRGSQREAVLTSAQGPAEIHIETRLNNSQSKPVTATVQCRVLDTSGKEVAATQRTLKLAAWSGEDVSQTTDLASPALWSPESPTLYTLETTIHSDGETVDVTKAEFGIRTFAFDATKGFLLNGKPYVIKGTCNHQDHAGVGVAMPDALHAFRVRKLKEMGSNALRTSHNPPTPELLETCDRLGMLVMDENRLLGSDASNLEGLQQFVRRDRNHASVFIWSIANEEVAQRSSAAGRIADTMQRLIHRLDPTRQCTAAMNSWSSDAPDGISTAIDVQGFNYLNNGDMDAFHRNNPDKPIIGTEEASAFTARGIYENTATYNSAYDDNKPGYGATAEEWWKFFVARPWASGSFVWTGFDYRGEPSPFGWPNISSHFGVLDTCGFPKDPFYYYKSWWSDKTVLHLMPHWNWPGKEGQEIDVRCFSNCDEVELLLNGLSLGKQTMPRDSHLRWRVKYAPGTLAGKGFKAGQLIAETKVETTGAPSAIQLSVDRPAIKADGEDLSVITVAVTDAQGRIVPTASDLVRFALHGPGTLTGLGNGDPICHEADTPHRNPNVRSVALANWRMKSIASSEDRRDVAAQIQNDGWSDADVHAEAGSLGAGESAIYRASLTVTAGDLGADNILLHCGMIDDEGWIYVNGVLAGETHDWQATPAVNIGKFLHAGGNTIAVVVKNNDDRGGLSKDVKVEFIDEPAEPEWKRSVFSGLAQVIVRAGHQVSNLVLEAQSPGLRNGQLTIEVTPSPLRPALPTWPAPERNVSTARK